MKCFTLHVMNLKYMKVSLFEISYKKKLTFSRHSNLLRCTCICIYSICIYVCVSNKVWEAVLAECLQPLQPWFIHDTARPLLVLKQTDSRHSASLQASLQCKLMDIQNHTWNRKLINSVIFPPHFGNCSLSHRRAPHTHQHISAWEAFI